MGGSGGIERMCGAAAACLDMNLPAYLIIYLKIYFTKKIWHHLGE
jgi:hypothetical protein